MKIDGKIRDEKLQCDINRKAAKIPVLSSDKIDKCPRRNIAFQSKVNDRTN